MNKVFGNSRGEAQNIFENASIKNPKRETETFISECSLTLSRVTPSRLPPFFLGVCVFRQ